MAVFDISGIQLARSYPVNLEQAHACSRKMVEGYGPLGFEVRIEDLDDSSRFAARISDSSGTDIHVAGTIVDDGTLCEVSVTLEGSVFVGGVKGLMATEKMVRSVANEQLSGFIDSGFHGVKRPPDVVEPETVEPETVDPETAEPEAAESDEPEAAESDEPEATESDEPEPNEAAAPEPTQAEIPNEPEPAPEPAPPARETEEEKATLIAQTIRASAIAAGAVTIQPIPLLDLALVTPIQATMVQTIGNIRGHKMDARTVMELMGTFGTGIATQQLVIAASKFVPVIGWAASITTAYAMTWAIGEVSDEYFANDRKMSNVELNRMFQKVFKTKKAEKQASAGASNTLKSKLNQLTAAREADLISEAEFTAKKEQLLSDF